LLHKNLAISHLIISSDVFYKANLVIVVE